MKRCLVCGILAKEPDDKKHYPDKRWVFFDELLCSPCFAWSLDYINALKIRKTVFSYNP